MRFASIFKYKIAVDRFGSCLPIFQRNHQILLERNGKSCLNINSTLKKQDHHCTNAYCTTTSGISFYFIFSSFPQLLLLFPHRLRTNVNIHFILFNVNKHIQVVDPSTQELITIFLFYYERMQSQRYIHQNFRKMFGGGGDWFKLTNASST